LPVKTVHQHTQDKPWVNDHFRHIIKQRQKAFSKGNLSVFLFYRNKANQLSHILKKKFTEKQMAELQENNCRQWWKKTKALL